MACRAPWDVVNLAAVWGLAQDRGYEAVSKESRSVVVSARLKRTGYRGVVDVVYGVEKPDPAVEKEAGRKRKADAVEGNGATGTKEQPLSKTQQRKRAKLARLEQAQKIGHESPKSVADQQASAGAKAGKASSSKDNKTEGSEVTEAG